MRARTRLLSILLTALTFLSVFSVIPKAEVVAKSNIIIGGVDIGYADGGFFTKNGKSCESSYWFNGICHGNGYCTASDHPKCNCMRYWPTGKKENCEVDLMTVQCHGFARYCQYILYGSHEKENSDLYRDITGVMYTSECTPNALKSKLLGCAPATHIRTRTTGLGYPHSIVIVSTSDSLVRIAECNADGRCEIKERSLTWSEFSDYIRKHGGIYFTNECKEGIRYTLSIRYNANGASVKLPEKKYDKYKVAILAGVNMRKGAGTGYGAVCTIPYGAEFVVTETKKSGGYTWGKTTYNGKAGWCVISQGWTDKVGSDAKAVYTVDSNGFVCRDGAVLVHKMYDGVTYDNGLYDCATLTLYHDDYEFIGWGTSPDGGVIFDQKEKMTADKLYANIAGGSGELTLYAIFSCNIPETQPEKDIPEDSTDDEIFVEGSGDVNFDGTLNVRDATAIQKHIALLVPLSDEGAGVADCDGDKAVTIKDATLVQKKSAGRI